MEKRRNFDDKRTKHEALDSHNISNWNKPKNKRILENPRSKNQICDTKRYKLGSSQDEKRIQ